jgi:ferredoxin
MLYIHPDECISCGLCESVCPVAAIYPTDRLPEELGFFEEINREFFIIAGIGSPRGARNVGALTCDHPLVANTPELSS